MLIRLPELITATIVWLKDHPATGREELCLSCERLERRSAWAAMDDEYEWVLSALLVIRWIREDPVVTESFGLPLDDLGATERQRCRRRVEIGEPLWCGRGRRQVVQLCRPVRRRSDESNRTIFSHSQVDPER